MRASLRVLFVLGLTVASIILFACTQFVDATLPVQEDSSVNATLPEQEDSSVNATLPEQGDSSVDSPEIKPSTEKPSPSVEVDWSDYQYYKNQKIAESPILQWQDNKAYATHLVQILRDEVVPQSVKALLAKFPKTFGYLEGREIGVGLAMNTVEDSAVASFYSDIPHTTPDKPVSGVYGLTVGYSQFSWEKIDESNFRLTSCSREELESAVVHEMMHAMMCESLTCGYTGRDSTLGKTASFPEWFREGTAEAVCGSARFVWKIAEKRYLLEQMEDKYMKEEVLQLYPLTADKHNSKYQTGWLAIMYLSHLASKDKALTPSSLAAGLDSILHQIHCGDSLSDTIQAISEGKFSGLDDFESKFTDSNDEVVDFCVELLNTVGKGRGSLLAENWEGDGLQDSDLLPNEPFDTPLFWLYVRNDRYTNKFEDKISAAQMFKGGAAYKAGVPGLRARVQ